MMHNSAQLFQAKFRDRQLISKLKIKIQQLSQELESQLKICHVCGTHEQTITRFGLRSLLPSNLQVIPGPGCPVCVTPASIIDAAIQLGLEGVEILSYGDLYRVPGSELSLADARAHGASVKIVYSILDAIRISNQSSTKDHVFIAIGFETTAPSTAYAALKGLPPNLHILLAHRLIPPAMELMLGLGELGIRGFLCPGHVATVIGTQPFRIFPESYRIPTVIAGFEPLDILFGIMLILDQLVQDQPRLDNEYSRSVKPEGNPRALKLIQDAFQLESGDWRGIGRIPDSAYGFKQELMKHDAVEYYGLKLGQGLDIRPGCCCHLVIIGKLLPDQCPLFLNECTPAHPLGPCMVSIEGSCRIWAEFHEG